MRIHSLVMILLVLIPATPVCFAQNFEIPLQHKIVRPYVESMIEGGDGYVGLGFVSRPGVEMWLTNVNINFETAVSTTDKIDVHSGTTYRVNGNGYFNFKKYFLAGGGYTWSTLRTNDYFKRSSHPYLSGGVMCELGASCEGMRFVVDYMLAGTDTRNGVRGPRFHWLAPLGSIHRNSFFFNLGFAYYSAYETDCPTCKRRGTGAMELGLRIQR